MATSRIIKTAFEDQDVLLAGMVGLHAGGSVDLDPTYGRGRFYEFALEPPRLRFDLAKRPGINARADVRRLPLAAGAVRSVLFDPPFLAGRSGDPIMGRKYGTIAGGERGYKEFVAAALAEIFRVLEPGGRLFYKCQDFALARRNFFAHVYVHDEAARAGFKPRDLFILVAKNRPLQNHLFRQVHARKFHVYFWVFEKPRPPGRPRKRPTAPPPPRSGGAARPAGGPSGASRPRRAGPPA